MLSRHPYPRKSRARLDVSLRRCYSAPKLKAGRRVLKPNKLIISRKGFDSGSGGWDSPTFPDGTMFSLPIPSSDEEAFEDPQHGDVDIASVATGITNGRMSALNLIHLDPDLNVLPAQVSPAGKGDHGRQQTGSAAPKCLKERPRTLPAETGAYEPFPTAVWIGQKVPVGGSKALAASRSVSGRTAGNLGRPTGIAGRGHRQ